MTGVITVTFLLEVNRAPFDLAEAESELITGYSTELGGFHFGLYYLGEYFHLFFFSMTFVIFFLGGWELPHISYLLCDSSEFVLVVEDFTEAWQEATRLLEDLEDIYLDPEHYLPTFAPVRIAL